MPYTARLACLWIGYFANWDESGQDQYEMNRKYVLMMSNVWNAKILSKPQVATTLTITMRASDRPNLELLRLNLH